MNYRTHDINEKDLQIYIESADNFPLKHDFWKYHMDFTRIHKIARKLDSTSKYSTTKYSTSVDFYRMYFEFLFSFESSTGLTI
jgi:hypothetical protein